jgi:DNA-binding transcriptional LysR family regulator
MINGPALIGFVAVAEAGSVHAAARRLNISQAALSRRIQRLESDVGAPLFVRANRRLTLTPAGVRLLARTQVHLEGLTSALAEAKQEIRTGSPTVTFGCLPSISRLFLPKILAAFLRSHPDTRVRVFDSSANQVIGHVLDRTADFGISLLGTVPADLRQEVLGDDPLVLLVHKDHPLARKKSVTWRMLVGEPLIAGGGPSGNRSLMESVKAHIGVDLDWRHEVQHIPTAIEWTGAGIAHTITPRLTLGDDVPGHLRCVEISAPHISRRIGILWRAGEKLDPRAEALRRSIGGELRRKLTQQAKHSNRVQDSLTVSLGESSARNW